MSVQVYKIVSYFNILFYFLFLNNAWAQQPKVISEIDTLKMGIHYDIYNDPQQLFSVIDSDVVILAVKENLLFIKGNQIIDTLNCPVHISAFDINKHGNGLLEGDNKVYAVKNFIIQNKPIPISKFNLSEEKFLWHIDMIDTTIARLFFTGTDSFYYLKIDSLEAGKPYPICNLETSYIINNLLTRYICTKGGLMYYFSYNEENNCDYLNIRSSSVSEQEYVKQINLGYLGSWATEVTPVRYDEETGDFFYMAYMNGILRLYKFTLWDYLD